MVVIKKGVVSIIVLSIFLFLASYVYAASPAVINSVHINDTDNFYSNYTGNSIIHVIVNASNIALPDIGNLVTANFSMFGNVDCGSGADTIFLSNATYGGDIFNGSCDVGDEAAASSFNGKPIIILAANTFGQPAIDTNLTAVLYNMTTLQMPPQVICQKFGPLTTDFSHVANFGRVNFIINIMNNFTCAVGNLPHPAGLSAEFLDVMIMNLTSVNLSTPEQAALLSTLPSVLTLNVSQPKIFPSLTRISIDATAFSALNTNASIKLLNMPFIVKPNVSSDNLTELLSTSWASNGFDYGFDMETGNLTINVLGFTEYNSTDIVPPAIALNSPVITVNNGTNLLVNVTVNGTGTEPSFIKISLNSSLSYKYNESSGQNTANCQNISLDQETFNCLIPINLSIGSYRLNVSAWDYGGNSPGNYNNSAIAFSILSSDSIPPNIIVAYPTNTIYNYIVHDLNFTASDNNAVSSCWYSDSDGKFNSSATDYIGNNFSLGTIVNDGIYNWTVYCNDTAGNVNFTKVIFQVDTTAPLVTILLPANTTYNSIVGVTNITLNENGDACIYSLDGTTNKSMTKLNNTNFGAVNSSMSQGQHKVIFSCNDTAGNWNSSAALYFIIDSIAPSLQLASPVDYANLTSSSVTFTFNASDLNMDVCDLYLDNSSEALTLANVHDINMTTGTNTSTISGIANGLHNWTVYCYDTVGNINQSTRYFTMDAGSPFLAFSSPVNTTYGTKSVTITITNNSASSVWWYNGTNNLSYAGSRSYNFSDGSHTIIAYANDSVGNVNSTSVTFVVETAYPQINFGNGTTNNGNYTGTGIIANITISDAGNNLDTLIINLYNSTGLYNSTVSASSLRLNYTNLPDGTYYLNATINDTLDHANYTATNTIRLDNSAPTITVYSPANNSIFYTNQSIYISFTAADASTNVDSMWWNNGTANKTYSALTSLKHNDAVSQQYTIILYANDSLNHVVSQYITFNVTSLPLNTTIISANESINANENMTDLVIGYNTTLKNVTVPSGLENFSVYINLEEMAINGNVSLGVNNFVLTRQGTNNYTVVIPANSSIYGSGWDGKIFLPMINTTTFTAPTTSGFSNSVNVVVDMGTGAELNFSSPVKIIIGGMYGKKAAWSRGSSTLTQITSVCDNETSPTNINSTNARECYINSANGNDLVIWTYHFTSFAAYTSTENPPEDTGTPTGSVNTGGGELTYIISDDEFTNGYTQSLIEASSIRVKINGSYSSIRIGLINDSAARVSVNNGLLIQTATLNIGDTKSFDVTNDATNDLSITLNSVSNSSAEIIVKKFVASTTPVTTPAANETTNTPPAENNNPVVNQTNNTTNNQVGMSLKSKILFIIVVILVLVALILAYLVYRKRRYYKKGF